MPAPALTAAQALEALRRLYADVDAEAEQLFERHRGRLKCRNGCSGCCVDDLTVFTVEAEHIRLRHRALLAGASPHPAGGCAFLDERDSCRIYTARPYVCRTQGLPLRWIAEQPDGTREELRDICPLNDEGEPITELPDAACWTIGPFEGRLARLQAGVDGGALRRVALRSLFGPRHDSQPVPRLQGRQVDVLVDLDGTLTDSGDGITRCIAHALAQLGRPIPDRTALNRYVGPPLAASFRTLLGAADDGLVREALRLYRERFVERGMFENRVYDGIPAALAALRALGVRLWVATTKPQIYARQILEHFDLLPYFGGVYGSELNGNRTDKGDLIAHLLTSERIAAPAAIMVGDREQDIRGARKNGVQALAVLWGYGSRAELEQARPDAVVESPHELAAAVMRLACPGT